MNINGPLSTTDTAVTGPIRDTTGYVNPLAIPALVKDPAIERVKQEILERYSMEATDAYCRDLIAFVEEMTRDSRE